jgi:hypothetical protein
MKTGDRLNNEVQMTIPSLARRSEAKVAMARRLVSPKSDEGGSEAKAALPRAFRADFRRKYLIRRVTAPNGAVFKKINYFTPANPNSAAPRSAGLRPDNRGRPQFAIFNFQFAMLGLVHGARRFVCYPG